MIAYEYIILDILYLFMHSVKKNVGRSAVSLHIAVIFAKIAELPLRVAQVWHSEQSEESRIVQSFDTHVATGYSPVREIFADSYKWCVVLRA